jgi:tetratricopeptide (TPR) repeat protein
MLWRRGAIPCSGHPDGDHDHAEDGDVCACQATDGDGDEAEAATGCLGADCRFGTEDGSCLIEDQNRRLGVLSQRMAESEERWENMILALVELTERLENVLEHEDEIVPPAAVPVEAEPVGTELERPRVPRGAHHTARLHLARGRIHYRQGRLEKAAACFRQALDSDASCADACNEMGLLETERGNPVAAIEHFRGALQIAPDMTAAYLNLGYVFYLQASHVEAAAMFTEAVERAPDSSTAWAYLGEAMAALDRLDEAEKAWEQAVALDPDNRRAAERLAALQTPAPVG